MRRTKRRLFECLGVLRTSTQTILMQLELAKRLIVELEQDFICGTWKREDGRLVSICKAAEGGYHARMFTGETLAAEMVVRSHNGQLQLHELLLPYPTPVIYFKSSELLLLGPHGIFRRLGSENRNLKQ